jgi:protoheme IX farnesyltransferase
VAGLAGRWYLAAAVVLGAGFTTAAVAAAVTRTVTAARRLFLASLLYLPLLFAFLLADRV